MTVNDIKQNLIISLHACNNVKETLVIDAIKQVNNLVLTEDDIVNLVDIIYMYPRVIF